MDEWPFPEGNPVDADSITCEECGDSIDITDTDDIDEVFTRIEAHGVIEHDWNTRDANLTYLAEQFGAAGLEHREELAGLSTPDHLTENYDSEWSAGIIYETGEISDNLDPRAEGINKTDLLTSSPHAPTEFRRAVLDAVTEVHNHGTSLTDIREELDVFTELLAQRDARVVLEWATEDGTDQTDLQYD